MKSLFVVAFLLLAARSTSAEPSTIEVFDDPGFTLRQGVMLGTTKTFYVRIQANYPVPGYNGMEFSLTGLHDLDFVATTWSGAPNVVLGTIAAPENPQGTGGINVSWPACQYDEAFLRLDLFTSQPPSNRTIQVDRRYPPTNMNFPFPLQNVCDAPCFCVQLVEGEAYTLNPTVAVEDRQWTIVKQLYAQ